MLAVRESHVTVSLKRNFTGAQRILGCFCQPFRGPWATDYYCTTNFYCASIKDGLMLYDLRPAFKESFSSIYLCSSRSLLCSQRNLAEICFDSLVNKETFLDTLFILFVSRHSIKLTKIKIKYYVCRSVF